MMGEPIGGGSCRAAGRKITLLDLRSMKCRAGLLILLVLASRPGGRIWRCGGMADAIDSKSIVLTGVEVRLLSPLLFK